MKLPLLAIFLCASVTAPALAQMVAPWEEAMLSSHCSAGNELVKAERQGDDLIAKHGEMTSISPLMLRAAAIAEKCSMQTTNANARDWYRFSAANDSFRSVLSASDAQSRWPSALATLKRLATGSAYPDVRAAAKQSYDMGNAAMKQNGM